MENLALNIATNVIILLKDKDIKIAETRKSKTLIDSKNANEYKKVTTEAIKNAKNNPNVLIIVLERKYVVRDIGRDKVI